MKFFTIAALSLGISTAYASVFEVGTLTEQEFQFQMSNPDALVDATTLDGYSSGFSSVQDFKPTAFGLTCYARDAARVTYWAHSNGVRVSSRRMQNATVRFCRAHSYVPWSCRAQGCRWEY